MKFFFSTYLKSNIFQEVFLNPYKIGVYSTANTLCRVWWVWRSRSLL